MLQSTQHRALPFNVPYIRNKSFVGRANIIKVLVEKLSNPEHLLDARVVLYGLGGVG
jgi:hypothetical protein